MRTGFGSTDGSASLQTLPPAKKTALKKRFKKKLKVEEE